MKKNVSQFRFLESLVRLKAPQAASFLALGFLLGPLSNSWSVAAPLCADIFTAKDSISPHENLKLLFDRSFQNIETAVQNSEHSSNPKAFQDVVNSHITQAAELLSAQNVLFNESSYNGMPALEIHGVAHGGTPLNALVNGLNKSGRLTVIYAPAELVVGKQLGFYDAKNQLLATSKESLREGRIDDVISHEAAHHYYGGRTQIGKPFDFSTTITWNDRGDLAPIPNLGVYSKTMSAEEVVNFAKDMALLSRWLKDPQRVPAEKYEDALHNLVLNAKRARALAENLLQGMELSRQIMEVFAGSSHFEAGANHIKGQSPYIGVPLKASSPLNFIYIHKENEKVLRVSLTHKTNKVIFLIPGDFDALFAEVQGLGYKKWSKDRLLFLEKELHLRVNSLTQAAQAVLPGLSAFENAMASPDQKNKKRTVEEVIDLASAPRKALSPWLQKPAGEKKKP